MYLYSVIVRLSMYLIATMPSSTPVSPYMEAYISVLSSSLINAWGSHYHLISQFIAAVHFLWIHLFSGFKSPVSKRFLVVLLVSDNIFVDVDGLYYGRLISCQVLKSLDKTSLF